MHTAYWPAPVRSVWANGSVRRWDDRALAAVVAVEAGERVGATLLTRAALSTLRSGV